MVDGLESVCAIVRDGIPAHWSYQLWLIGSHALGEGSGYTDSAGVWRPKSDVEMFLVCDAPDLEGHLRAIRRELSASDQGELDLQGTSAARIKGYQPKLWLIDIGRARVLLDQRGSSIDDPFVRFEHLQPTRDDALILVQNRMIETLAPACDRARFLAKLVLDVAGAILMVHRCHVTGYRARADRWMDVRRAGGPTSPALQHGWEVFDALILAATSYRNNPSPRQSKAFMATWDHAHEIMLDTVAQVLGFLCDPKRATAWDRQTAASALENRIACGGKMAVLRDWARHIHRRPQWALRAIRSVGPKALRYGPTAAAYINGVREFLELPHPVGNTYQAWKIYCKDA